MLTRRSLLTGLAATSLPAPLWSQTSWPRATLAEAGLDPAALAELVTMIDTGVTLPNIHALLIEHRGRLVFERYWPGEDWRVGTGPTGMVAHGPDTLHSLWSVSKSVTSLLLGIALAEDAADMLHRPLAQFFPGWPRAETITLHHALTMTAGLGWNETLVRYDSPRNDFVRLVQSDDPVGYVLGKPQRHPPGDKWAYNSGLTDLIGAVIAQATGTSLTAFAEAKLFGPLGITDYVWWRPAPWPDDGFPSASAGLRMRARDAAKFGALILQEGRWQERQIVPAAWLALSTADHLGNPWLRYGYGYQWWTGRLVSGHAMIYAAGSGGQKIYVLPDLGLSITILAGNYAKPMDGVGERILGRIVRALRQ